MEQLASNAIQHDVADGEHDHSRISRLVHEMTIAGHAAHLKELGLTPDMPEQLRKLQAEYDALTIERDGLRVDRDGLRAERNELQVERDKVVEANRKLAEFLKIQEQQLGEANNKARFVLQLERDYAAMRHDRDVWAHHAHRIRNEYQTFRQGIIHFVPHPAPPAKPRHVQYSIPQAAEPPAPVHVPGQLNGSPIAPTHKRRTQTHPAILPPHLPTRQPSNQGSCPISESSAHAGSQVFSPLETSGSTVTSSASSRRSVSQSSLGHLPIRIIDLTGDAHGQDADAGSRKRRRTSETLDSPLLDSASSDQVVDPTPDVHMFVDELMATLPQPPSVSPQVGITATEGPAQDANEADDEIQAFLDRSFEADDNDEDKIWCIMCRKRYSTGNVKEPPTPFIDADVDELMKHCELEHPKGYERLREKMSQSL